MQLKIDKSNYLKRRNFWIAKNTTNKQTKIINKVKRQMTNLETFITCIIYYVYDRQRNACMDIDIKNQLRRNIDLRQERKERESQ